MQSLANQDVIVDHENFNDDSPSFDRQYSILKGKAPAGHSTAAGGIGLLGMWGASANGVVFKKAATEQVQVRRSMAASPTTCVRRGA